MAVSRRLRFEILRRDGHTCRYCGAQAPTVELTVDHVIPVTLGGSDDPSNLVAACTACNGGKSSVPADAPLVANVSADALRWKEAMERAREEFEAEREVLAALVDDFAQAWERWTYPVEVDVPPPDVSTGDPLDDNWHRLLGWSGQHSEPVAVVSGVLLLVAERGYTTEVRRAARKSLAMWSQVLGEPVTDVRIEQGPVNPPPKPPLPTKRTERRLIPLDDNWSVTIERFLSLGLTIDDFQRFIDIAMGKRDVTVSEKFRYFCGCCWRHLTDLQESARRILEEEGRG